MTSEVPEPGDSQPLPWAADLSSLIRHSQRVPDELEAAWSRALNSDEVAVGLEHFNTRAQAVFGAVLAAAERDGNATRLPVSVPPSPSEWTAISDGSLSQDALGDAAMLVALDQAAQEVARLRSPATQSVDLLTGRVEAIWESGGFARLRDQLELLERLVGPDTPIPVEECVRLIEMAQRAALCGLPEAALVYLRMAAEPLSVVLADPADEPGARADIADWLGDESAAWGQLTDVVQAMGHGDRPDLAVQVLLMRALLDRFIDVANARIFGVDGVHEDGARGQ